MKIRAHARLEDMATAMHTELDDVLDRAGLAGALLSVDQRPSGSVVVWLSTDLEDPAQALVNNAECGSMPIVVHPETGRLVRRLTVDAAERWNTQLLHSRMRGERGDAAPPEIVGSGAEVTADGRCTIGRCGRLVVDTSGVPPLLIAPLFPRDLRPVRSNANPAALRRIAWVLLSISGGTDDRLHVMRNPGDPYSIERAVALTHAGASPKQIRMKARSLTGEADEDRRLIELFEHDRYPAAVWDP
jgi:hypothetical protein